MGVVVGNKAPSSLLPYGRDAYLSFLFYVPLVFDMDHISTTTRFVFINWRRLSSMDSHSQTFRYFWIGAHRIGPYYILEAISQSRRIFVLTQRPRMPFGYQVVSI